MLYGIDESQHRSAGARPTIEPSSVQREKMKIPFS